jgi:ABC-type nitrate/sulfonate/bicarbonate transport system substrate-binding protein
MKPFSARRGWAVLALAAVLIVGFGAGPGHAADTLRVGKAVAGPFDFTPLDVGIAKGFFAKHGLTIEEVDFAGSAKLQQGLGADAIDVGLGSGPELAFVAKGNTDLAIAAFAGPPDSQVLAVAATGKVARARDLKGKKIGVSTVGSLTDWLVRELSRQQGWGPDGIDPVALGSTGARISALRSGSVDGMVTDVATSIRLKQQGIAHTIVHFGKVAPDFIIHAIFATDKMIKERPDDLHRFLAGWFETIAWMRRHKAETVKIVAPVMHQPADIVALNYDQVMPTFSLTGRFEKKALAVLARSFVEMHVLPRAPDMKKLYTERFLPGATM